MVHVVAEPLSLPCQRGSRQPCRLVCEAGAWAAWGEQLKLSGVPVLGCMDCLACYRVLLGGENALAALGPNCGSALVLDVAGVISSQGERCLSWPAGNVRRGWSVTPTPRLLPFSLRSRFMSSGTAFRSAPCTEMHSLTPQSDAWALSLLQRPSSCVSAWGF